MFSKKEFGSDFKWGTTICAFQNEGWANSGNKGVSIWDTFTNGGAKINNNDQINNASNFYKDYENDIELAASLNLKVFRFSLSWTRIIPKENGNINKEGIDFYHKVIDACLKYNLEPWITLYHWDLPQYIEDKGGWTNRDILKYFNNYANICSKSFGDKVKHWIVLNEPMSFTGLGYFLGYHAPERKGISNFLKAAHHAALCNAEGARIIRRNVSQSIIGTAFSCSYVKPINKKRVNKNAAARIEAILNRFFIEPCLGLGYPTDIMPGLNIIKHYHKKGDEQLLKFDFDFIGIQYYFRVIAKFSILPPVLFASEVSPKSRTRKINAIGLEVYPKGLSKMLKFYNQYDGINNIIVTESGVCFADHIHQNKIYDIKRLRYHKKMLKEILKCKKKGINISGYLIWTLIDNFEWKEGFEPRFGIVHNDFQTQKRTIKYSGHWFKKFLS